MNGFAYGSIVTPLGRRFCVAARGDGVCSSAFIANERVELARLVRLYGPRAAADAHVREALRQARAYFAKRLRRFDVPLDLEGTPFEVAVWETVAQLEAGTLVSYGEVARAVGRPLSHRGVARAMGQTPLALFIPAHRVIGADGRIKGERGATQMRRRLLAFEGITLPR